MDKPYVVGMDIGGTNTVFGIVDARGNILSVDSVKTQVYKEFGEYVAAVAERTGCAIVLVGHLNKMQSANSSYRGLGSIDFRAAARSVLLVGRMKKEPNVRIIVHDKSSLAPEGKSIAFSLGDENGFHWLDGYNDITAEELLCGINAETKTAAAEQLILDMLSDGEPVMCKTVQAAAKAKGISKRTLDDAKQKIGGIKTEKPSKYWTWQLPK